MSASADIADRDEQMLARLAELDLAAAERAHVRLMTAEDAHEIADLGRTYQRLARSLRQTLALKVKLKREREQAQKDPQVTPAKPSGMAIARRIGELRDGVLRVIWNEAEERRGRRLAGRRPRGDDLRGHAEGRLRRRDPR